MIISDTASQIISTGSGFRNPSLYGSGEYELKKVLEYEIGELYNDGLLDTCKYLYGINTDINSVCNYFSSLLHTKNLYCVWLTTRDNVASLYDGDEYNIKEIILPDNYFIICDLGVDGVLFVSDEYMEVK